MPGTAIIAIMILTAASTPALLAQAESGAVVLTNRATGVARRYHEQLRPVRRLRRRHHRRDQVRL